MKTLNRNRRLSAVSMAIRNVQEQTESTQLTSTQTDNTDSYTISIANSKDSRSKAFQLAYEVYLAKGYISENARKMLVSPSDSLSDTCVININDGKDIVASITLNFQDHCRLPCQELYPNEIAPLIEQRKRLVEITRLVIKENHRHSNYLLAQLFQATYIYAFQIKNITELVIEVNPRHVGFYQKLLGFSILGGEKSCERVNNAPALLLHLDLNFIYENLQKFYKNNLNVASKFKFFKYAIAEDKANSLRIEFKRSHRPITLLERIYFGIKQIKTPELTGAM